MKKMIQLSAGALAALTLSSCVQQEEHITINTDGTSKFTLKVHVNLGKLNQLAEGFGPGGGGEKKAVDGKKIALQLIKGSKGVDVWSDYKTTTDNGGNVHVTLSGYAEDVTKLKLGSGMEAIGDGQGPQKKDDQPGFGGEIVAKEDGDDWLIGFPDEMGGKKAPKDGEKLDDAAIAKKIAEGKMEMQMMAGMMGPMLKDAKLTRTLEVAGKIKDEGCFTKSADNKASVTVDFGAVLKYLGEVVNTNEAAVKKAIANGGSAGDALSYVDMKDKKERDKATKGVFGKSGALQMRVEPADDDLFDYEAESAKAEKGQTAELKALLKEAGVEEK